MTDSKPWPGALCFVEVRAGCHEPIDMLSNTFATCGQIVCTLRSGQSTPHGPRWLCHTVLVQRSLCVRRRTCPSGSLSLPPSSSRVCVPGARVPEWRVCRVCRVCPVRPVCPVCPVCPRLSADARARGGGPKAPRRRPPGGASRRPRPPHHMLTICLTL